MVTMRTLSVPLRGLSHLMRLTVASRIMRTTIDLDATVLQQLKRRSQRTGKSMSQLASELLARSLDDADRQVDASPKLSWIANELGRARVDLEDKEAVRALLEPVR